MRATSGSSRSPDLSAQAAGTGRTAPLTVRLAAAANQEVTEMGPLAGLRIVEMAGIGPAPFAATLLADMGAELIRVDRREATDLGLPGREAKFNVRSEERRVGKEGRSRGTPSH